MKPQTAQIRQRCTGLKLIHYIKIFKVCCYFKLSYSCLCGNDGIDESFLILNCTKNKMSSNSENK